MDLMQDLRRTCYCGEVTKAGETVVVGGFVQKVRNLGNLIFIDLRDRTGIVQLAFNDQTDRAIFEKAASCHSEYVLLAKGVVAERSSINKDMKTLHISGPAICIANWTSSNDFIFFSLFFLFFFSWLIFSSSGWGGSGWGRTNVC